MGFQDAWSGYGSEHGEEQHSPMPSWIRRGIIGGLGAMFGYGAAGALGAGAGTAASGSMAMPEYAGVAGSSGTGWSALSSGAGGMDFPWGSVISAAGNLFGGQQANQANQQMSADQRNWQTQMQFQNQIWNAEQAGVTRDWTADQAAMAREWSADQAILGRDFNAQQAQANRDFQERMSNTQYQRATADMMAAGLNPMLGYSQGGAGNVSGSTASSSAPSASGPSGAQASSGGVGSSPIAHFQNVIGPAVATALQAASTEASIRNLYADTEVKRNQALRELAEIDLRKSQTRETSARAISREVDSRVDTFGESSRRMIEPEKWIEASNRNQLLSAQVRSTDQDVRESESRTTLNKYKYNEGKAYSDFYGSAYGHASPYLKSGADLAGDIAGAAASSAFGLRALKDAATGLKFLRR